MDRFPHNDFLVDWNLNRDWVWSGYMDSLVNWIGYWFWYLNWVRGWVWFSHGNRFENWYWVMLDHGNGNTNWLRYWNGYWLWNRYWFWYWNDLLHCLVHGHLDGNVDWMWDRNHLWNWYDFWNMDNLRNWHWFGNMDRLMNDLNDWWLIMIVSTTATTSVSGCGHTTCRSNHHKQGWDQVHDLCVNGR